VSGLADELKAVVLDALDQRLRPLEERVEKAPAEAPDDDRALTVQEAAEFARYSLETIMERIMVVARNQGLAVHHVTVHHLRDKLAISLDLEVDRALSLGEAHEVASKLEAAIRGDFGHKIEVETHIEPMETGGISGRDAPIELQTAIAATMRKLVLAAGPIRDVHSVRVRETPQGLVVNFHCRADPGLSVEAVHHAVDELERRLRNERDDIHRVIGHAEPSRAPDAVKEQ